MALTPLNECLRQLRIEIHLSKALPNTILGLPLSKRLSFYKSRRPVATIVIP